MPVGGVRTGAGRKPDPNSRRQKAAARRAAKDAAAQSVEKPRSTAKKSVEKAFTEPDGNKAVDAPANWPFGTEPPKDQEKQVDPENQDGLTDEQRAGLSPLEYLLAVMRSPEASKSARMQAAIQAAPYMHARPAPMGKKETKQKDAEKTGGRFSASAPPKLVAAGGKRI